ncbi:MAG: hypothetical protein PF480_14820, partial [Roseovarius sp.]|nr:hypothetical protein [Roseovarius sp.]
SGLANVARDMAGAARFGQRRQDEYLDQEEEQGAPGACCSKVGTGFELPEHAKSIRQSMLREFE